MDSKEFSAKICKVLSDKKGQDIIRIDVKDKSSLADYFIVASGRSTTQTRALAEYVEEEMDKLGVMPNRREGVKDGRWAVIDYGDVIVHVFSDETRLFYHLEKLWGSEENIERFE